MDRMRFISVIFVILVAVPSAVARDSFSVGGFPIAAVFGVIVTIIVIASCCRFLCRSGAYRNGTVIGQTGQPVTIITQTGPVPNTVSYPPSRLQTSQTTVQQMPYPTQSYGIQQTAYPPYPSATSTTTAYPPYPTTASGVSGGAVYPPYPSSTNTSYPAYSGHQPTSGSGQSPTAPLLDEPPPMTYAQVIQPPPYSALFPENVNKPGAPTGQ